ncbi:MAG: DEAD/DEAH box helicase, partial [Thermoleophilaceae bacterium]|nr:DEAD/DEAH box helicase [Thermoleophilaceae bacterium]
PTRELAVQINEDWMSFARSLKMRSAICVGGVNIGRQIDSLSRKPRVVIGTPGRLKDLLQNGHLRLRKTEIVVLDEADRMLDMGFINDIRVLLRALPEQRQSLCFSATITPGIKDLLDDMLVDPFTASVRTNVTNNHIEQQVVQAVSKDDKLNQLANMLLQDEFEKVIVFGRTKHGVQKLSDKLNKRGLKTEAIHGNKSQNQRQRSLQAFKNNQAQALIATDVASRGLDIPEVSHVINFDQPETYDDYIHRIGRTGRAGNGGTAITFVEVA